MAVSVCLTGCRLRPEQRGVQVHALFMVRARLCEPIRKEPHHPENPLQPVESGRVSIQVHSFLLLPYKLLLVVNNSLDHFPAVFTPCRRSRTHIQIGRSGGNALDFNLLRTARRSSRCIVSTKSRECFKATSVVFMVMKAYHPINSWSLAAAPG